MSSGKINSSPIKNCEECMELFKYSPSVERKGHARFCSRVCQGLWQSYERSGKKPYEMTKQIKENISEATKGRKSPNKGKKMPWVTGDNNHNWKGDNASYRSLHSWVARKLGQPTTCSECGKTNLFGRAIHWSNISGDYRRELDDWQRLCAKCHGAYDKKLRVARMRG